MRRALAIGTLLAATAAIGIGAPAVADDDDAYENDQDQPYHTKIFLAAAYVSPLSKSDQNFDGVEDSVEATDKLGWEAGVAGRFNPLVGFELSYLNATHDVDFGGQKIGQADFEPISATLEFHIVPTQVVDFWVGPTVSWVHWGDLKLVDGEIKKGSTDTAYGATVGLDIGLGPNFAITGAVRYLNAKADWGDFKDTKVDPLFARLGVAVRF